MGIIINDGGCAWSCVCVTVVAPLLQRDFPRDRGEEAGVVGVF